MDAILARQMKPKPARLEHDNIAGYSVSHDLPGHFKERETSREKQEPRIHVTRLLEYLAIAERGCFSSILSFCGPSHRGQG